MTSPDLAPGEVQIDTPARHRSLRLLRLAAADAAAELDLDIERVESARIAIDELAALLLATGLWNRLIVRVRTDRGSLEVHGEVRGLDGHAEPVRLDRVVEELLAVCVDSYELLDGPSFRFAIDTKVAARSAE